MKTFFRVISGVLLVTLLLTFSLWQNEAFPDLSGITSFAKDTSELLQSLGGYQPSGAADDLRPTNRDEDFSEFEPIETLDAGLEALLCEAFRTCSETVDVSAYEKTPEQIKQAMTAVRFAHPEFFYVDKEYKYSHSGGIVSKLQLQYTTASRAEAEALTAEYEAMLAEIVAGAPQNGTDFDKVLYIHDYFVQNFCYDYTYTIRDAYAFFKEKTGVCQAYMLAMIAVAEELGIKSIPVTSQRMNHAWNLVELDGEWYHVDITWDDAASYPSYTSYQYFLQSDAGIVAIDSDRIDESKAVPDWHCDWALTQAADDTRYDNAVWRHSQSPIQRLGDAYYCVVSRDGAGNSNGAIYGGNDPAAMSACTDIVGIWRLPSGNQHYVACYATVVAYEGLLIYNTPNSLRSYDPTTGEDRLIALLVTLAPRSIYGITDVSQDGAISFVAAYTATPDEAYPAYEILTYHPAS